MRRAGAAVGDHGLIEPGDHIMVAVSGGKDSLVLLEVLELLRRRSPVNFRLTAVTLITRDDDQAFAWLGRHYREQGYAHHFESVPIDHVVQAKIQDPRTPLPCVLCSRLRRGVLYTLAIRLRCTKIALGHHLDDLIETLLLNLFFSGQLRTMAPRRRSDDGCNVVIRPLCYVPEAWIRQCSVEREFHTLTCDGAHCKVAAADGRRAHVKRLVQELAASHPQVRYQALRALRTGLLTAR